MDLDEDLFADDSRPAVNQGRGRFRPRAKPKPGKETTASVSSSLPSNTNEKALTESLPSLDATQSIQPFDRGSVRLANPVGSSGVNLAFPEIREPLENNEEKLSGATILGDNLKSQVGNPLSEADTMRDELDSIDVQPIEVLGKCDRHFSFEIVTNEADSTKFDLDPFVNVNPEPTERSVNACGKYRPKGKAQPRNETSASTPLILPNNVKQKAVAQIFNGSDIEQLVQPVDVADKDNFADSVGLSFATLETVGTKENLQEIEVSANAMDLEVAVSDGCEDFHSSSKKAVEDMLSGLECLNNFSNQSTNGTETPLIDSDNKDRGENAGIQGQVSVSISTPRVFDTTQVQNYPDLFMTQDPVTCSGVAIFDNHGGILVDDGRLETEVQQLRAFSDLDTLDFMSEATVASGLRAGKYKPKPKVRTEEETPNISMAHPDAVESVMHPQTAKFVSSEPECMSEGSVPFLPPDHVFDYSSIDLGDIIHPDPTTSEFSMNEELTNLAETSYADATTSGNVQPEDVHGIAENLRSNESSLIGEETKGGKSSRQLRKRVAVLELIDEPDDEAHDDENFTAEPPSSNVDEDEGNVDGYRVESKSQKKRASRRSKKPLSENEKPVRKCKKANEASEQSTEEPSKKFAHSTRRKRRRVSKELLETPEEEIDPRKVPMKDLILLAECKERLAIKEAKTSTPPLTNQSTENIDGEEDYHNEEETFASQQGKGYTGDQAPCRVQSSSLYFNYQSYMKKSPTVRWSKQDTELFYEAVQQFGTDLSMIQQLFPARTRQQIKLKYKKEERKQPLRLTEALTNRAKDHSHFEKVIEQLQQVAAKTERDANGDDSGEEVEDLTTEINDEAEKVEQDDGKADFAEVHSPLNADEIDDDNDIWSSYKSEF